MYEEDEYDDFEAWEFEAELFDRKDWAGLVEYRLEEARRHPDNGHCQWALGEAYVLNKEYEKAISFLGGLHKRYADNPNIQNSLLDALFASGKDEIAVDWVIRPAVLRLEKSTSDYCYDFLKSKRKPRSIYNLYLEFYGEGYPAFSAEQLIPFLQSDDRFILTGCENRSYDCFISVNRQKKRGKS